MSDVEQLEKSGKYKASKLASFFMAGFYVFLFIHRTIDHPNSYLLNVIFFGYALVLISYGLNPASLVRAKGRFNLKTMPKSAKYCYCTGFAIILISGILLIVETFAPQFFS